MRIIKKIIRVFLIAVGVILLFLFIFIGLLQTEYGQNLLRKKTVSYLQNKLGTKVAIGKITTNWLTNVEIDQVLLEDQSKQILLSLGKLKVNYKLFDFFDDKITVNRASIDTLYIRLSRSQSDSTFNFDYIVNAISGDASAQPTDAAKKTKLYSWLLGNLAVRQFKFLMDDQYDKQYYNVSSDSIFLSVNNIDPDKQEYFFKKFFTNGLKVAAKSGIAASTTTTKTAATILPFLKADSILLANNNLQVDLKEPAFTLNSTAKEISTTNLKLDLNNNQLQISKVLLQGESSSINWGLAPPLTPKEIAIPAEKSKTFIFSIDNFQFSHQQLKADQNGSPKRLSKQLDYNHLALQNIILEADSIRYNGENYTANLRRFTMADKSGFNIKKLQGSFHYSDKELQLNKLVAETGNSQLMADVKLNYPSIEAIQKNPALLKINAAIAKGEVGKQDLALLGLNEINDPYLKKITAQDVSFKGKVKGAFNQLVLSDIQLKQAGLNLGFSGNINGLPNLKNMQATINLNQFSGSKKSLETLLPAGIIPTNISIPDQFLAKGKVSGTMDNINLDLLLNSSDGNLLLKGRIVQLKGKEKFAYTIRAASAGLQIGKLLKDTLYGLTSFDLVANGKGIDLHSADAGISGNIPAVYLHGYSYKNIDIVAGLKHSLADLDFNIHDVAVVAAVKGQYSLDSLHPILKTDATIDLLDLKMLGFTKDSTIIKTSIHANLTNISARHINGTISIPSVELYKDGENWKLDSAIFTAVNIDSLQQINVQLPFATLNMDGQFEIDALREVTKQLLLNYLVQHPDKSGTMPVCTAAIKVDIKDHEMLHALLPALTVFKELSLSGQVDTRKNYFSLTGAVPYLQYEDYEIDSTQLMIVTEANTLKARAVSDGINFSKIKLHKAVVATNINDGLFNWNIDLFKTSDSVFYQLKGNALNDSAAWVLQLDDQQLLSGERWQASANNEVTIFKTAPGFLSDITLTSGEKKLSVNSAKINNGLPLNLEVNEFPISTLTKLLDTDSSIADGKINGKATLQSLSPFSFTSALSVDSFKTYGALIGNLKLTANNDTADKGYFANLLLSGNNNSAAIYTNYNAQGDISGDIKIDSLSVNMLQPFLQQYFSGLNGKVQGGLKIKGKLTEPAVTGTLTATDVSGNYTDYNTFFNLPVGTVDFFENGIRLNNLVVKDKAGNTVMVGGDLNTKNYLDYTYNLSVKSAHFLVAGKKQQPKQTIHGPVWVTADIKIGSKKEVIVVTGNVAAVDKSEINFEMDWDEISSVSAGGIIEYYDANKQQDSLTLLKISSNHFAGNAPLKMDINLNVAINKESKLKIILDKTGGEYLKASGDANLTLTVNPEGRINLLGAYLVESGEYILNMSDVIKRKFDLVKGGTIKWDGDPYNAKLDLTAMYEVTTTVEPLVSGSQFINLEAYKQRLPFQIYLTLKQEMLKPDIAFKLDMKEKDRNEFEGAVYSRIKQINMDESELNKQVMSLLVLNSFIAPDPLGSASSGFTLVTESAARATAGKILSQQLNSLAGSMLKDVEIDFNLDSKLDYSSGQKEAQTDLSVNIKKSLFNDRTIVTLGSTIALEGSAQHKNQSSGFGDNASIEYKLTKNGKYRIKVYRVSEFETTVNGQVVQAGLNFVLVIDYNHFKELFKSSEKRKRLRAFNE